MSISCLSGPHFYFSHSLLTLRTVWKYSLKTLSKRLQSGVATRDILPARQTRISLSQINQISHRTHTNEVLIKYVSENNVLKTVWIATSKVNSASSLAKRLAAAAQLQTTPEILSGADRDEYRSQLRVLIIVLSLFVCVLWTVVFIVVAAEPSTPIVNQESPTVIKKVTSVPELLLDRLTILSIHKNAYFWPSMITFIMFALTARDIYQLKYKTSTRYFRRKYRLATSLPKLPAESQ